MAKLDGLDLFVGRTGTEDLELQRRMLSTQLQRLEHQRRSIESWQEELQRRASNLERQWAELLGQRDRIEEAIWERMRASEQRLPAPTVADAVVRPVDPAPEPWDIEELQAGVPTPVDDGGTARFGISIRDVLRPAPRPGARGAVTVAARRGATAPIVLRTWCAQSR